MCRGVSVCYEHRPDAFELALRPTTGPIRRCRFLCRSGRKGDDSARFLRRSIHCCRKRSGCLVRAGVLPRARPRRPIGADRARGAGHAFGDDRQRRDPGGSTVSAHRFSAGCRSAVDDHGARGHRSDPRLRARCERRHRSFPAPRVGVARRSSHALGKRGCSRIQRFVVLHARFELGRRAHAPQGDRARRRSRSGRDRSLLPRASSIKRGSVAGGRFGRGPVGSGIWRHSTSWSAATVVQTPGW